MNYRKELNLCEYQKSQFLIGKVELKLVLMEEIFDIFETQKSQFLIGKVELTMLYQLVEPFGIIEKVSIPYR